MSALVAHVAGVPLEEGLLTLTPVAGLLAAAVTVRLRALRSRRRGAGQATTDFGTSTQSVLKEHR